VVLSHICVIDICHAGPVLSCGLGSRCALVEERSKKSLSSVFKAGPRCFSLCSTSTFLSLAGKIPSNTICARRAFQHLCRTLFLEDQGKHMKRLFISGPTERLQRLRSIVVTTALAFANQLAEIFSFIVMTLILFYRF
jgi:hypothetical protein